MFMCLNDYVFICLCIYIYMFPCDVNTFWMFTIHSGAGICAMIGIGTSTGAGTDTSFAQFRRFRVFRVFRAVPPSPARSRSVPPGPTGLGGRSHPVPQSEPCISVWTEGYVGVVLVHTGLCGVSGRTKPQGLGRQ